VTPARAHDMIKAVVRRFMNRRYWCIIFWLKVRCCCQAPQLDTGVLPMINVIRVIRSSGAVSIMMWLGWLVRVEVLCLVLLEGIFFMLGILSGHNVFGVL